MTAYSLRITYTISLLFTALLASTIDYKDVFIESLKNYPLTVTNFTIEYTNGTYKGFTSQVVSYTADSLKQYALVNIPDTKQKDYPVVIVNHGYIPPDKYSVTSSYRLIAAYFARNGFVVIKPDYRGHDKSEGIQSEPLERLYYPVDVFSAYQALDFIKEARRDEVFIWGHSMGVEVSLKVIASGRCDFKAASMWAGVTEAFPESMLYFRRKRHTQEAEDLRAKLDALFTQEAYNALSVPAYYSRITLPVIIHHGTLDDSCPFEWGVEFYNGIKNHSKNAVFHQYEDDHNFSKKYFYTVLERDRDFFRRYTRK